MSDVPTAEELASAVRSRLDAAWGAATVWTREGLELRWYAAVGRLATVGVSALPQPVPSDLRVWERIELVVELAGAAPASADDPRVQRLAELAGLPAAGLRLVGGEPVLIPEELRGRSGGCAALWLATPAGLAADACDVGRQPLRLGQVVALSALEAEVADRLGEAVLADLRTRLPGAPWAWEPDRPCAVLALLAAASLPGPRAGLRADPAVLAQQPTAVRPAVQALLAEGRLVPAVTVRLAPLVFALQDPRHGVLLLAPPAARVQEVFAALRLAPGRRLLGIVRHLAAPGGALVADLRPEPGQETAPVQAGLVDLLAPGGVDLEALTAAIPDAVWHELQRRGDLALAPLDAAVRRLDPWLSLFPGRPLEVPYARPGTSGARQVVWRQVDEVPPIRRRVRQRLLLVLAIVILVLLWSWLHRT